MDSKSDVYTYFMSTQIISKSEGKSIIFMHRKLDVLKKYNSKMCKKQGENRQWTGNLMFLHSFMYSPKMFKKRGKIENAQKS